jgi:hypothetical protein
VWTRRVQRAGESRPSWWGGACQLEAVTTAAARWGVGTHARPQGAAADFRTRPTIKENKERGYTLSSGVVRKAYVVASSLETSDSLPPIARGRRRTIVLACLKACALSVRAGRTLGSQMVPDAVPRALHKRAVLVVPEWPMLSPPLLPPHKSCCRRTH